MCRPHLPRQEESREEHPHCDRFAKLNVDAGISRNGFADSMFAEGNGVGHLLVFNDQQSRQNLGDAGRIALLVHVFIV